MQLNNLKKYYLLNKYTNYLQNNDVITYHKIDSKNFPLMRYHLYNNDINFYIVQKKIFSIFNIIEYNYMFSGNMICVIWKNINHLNSNLLKENTLIKTLIGMTYSGITVNIYKMNLLDLCNFALNSKTIQIMPFLQNINNIFMSVINNINIFIINIIRIIHSITNKK
jgi:hypothetical protein